MAAFERLVEDHLNGGNTGCQTEPPINGFQGVNVMKKITVIAAAFALSGLSFSAVEAAPSSDLPSTVVRIADLDTSRPADQHVLYLRLTRAAHVVCRSYDPSTSTAKQVAKSMHEECMNHALAGALAMIDRPEFTDYVVTKMPKLGNAGIRLAAR